MTLTQDISQAAKELRQERHAERAFYRKIRRYHHRHGRRPSLIHKGKKARLHANDGRHVR